MGIYSPRMSDLTTLRERFAKLTTPHVADACIRLGFPVRCAPAELQAMIPGDRLFGRVLPARHAGSVDVFLEAFEHAAPGDVLVVDNAGRRDESCVGDLVVHEARLAGLAGLIVWGLHRDTVDILAIGLPLFSTGTIPTGPQRLDGRHPEALSSAAVGEWTVGPSDLVMADADGVLFIANADAEAICDAAERIRDVERVQADRIRAGASLRAQVGFAAYLAAREGEPDLTFREHLRRVGGAIEE